MIGSAPVERVVSLLASHGYIAQAVPLNVASMQFDFCAVLTRRAYASDLVIVVDTLTEGLRLPRAVEGLARALDLVGSRRAITTIVVGPPPRGAVVDAMSKVSRVLMVGTPTGEHADRAIRDCLAVLLPLELPQVTGAALDPLGQVHNSMSLLTGGALLQPLVAAAPQGAAAVETALTTFIEAPLRSEDL